MAQKYGGFCVFQDTILKTREIDKMFCRVDLARNQIYKGNRVLLLLGYQLKIPPFSIYFILSIESVAQVASLWKKPAQGETDQP